MLRSNIYLENILLTLIEFFFHPKSFDLTAKKNLTPVKNKIYLSSNLINSTPLIICSHLNFIISISAFKLIFVGRTGYLLLTRYKYSK